MRFQQWQIYFTVLQLYHLVHCQDKEVVQSGQPTHFHMEDRGPEIQVTADAEGVKINAKPAGLNVVAKPGHIPATIPHEHIISTLVGHGHHYNMLEAPHYHPQLVHYAPEPMAFQAPINGLAYYGGDTRSNIFSPAYLPALDYSDYHTGLSDFLVNQHIPHHHHSFTAHHGHFNHHRNHHVNGHYGIGIHRPYDPWPIYHGPFGHGYHHHHHHWPHHAYNVYHNHFNPYFDDEVAAEYYKRSKVNKEKMKTTGKTPKKNSKLGTLIKSKAYRSR